FGGAGGTAQEGAAGGGPAIRFERWLTEHKLPVGEAVTALIEWVKVHGATLFRVIGVGGGGAITGGYTALGAVPPVLIILAAAVLAWRVQRSWALAAFVIAGLLLIMNQGYWQQTLETLALVLVSTIAATVIGIPLGIACAHRPPLAAALRPV